MTTSQFRQAFSICNRYNLDVTKMASVKRILVATQARTISSSQDALISYNMMEEIACVGREEAMKFEQQIITGIMAEFDTEAKAYAELELIFG